MRGNRNLMALLVADLVFVVVSFFAELERSAIRQRQAEGIAVAKARGVKFGRSPMEQSAGFLDVCAEGQMVPFQRVKLANVRRITLYVLEVG